MNYEDCIGRPVLGFAAYSGTGKTTLLTQLIPLLRQQGLRIAVIKHAHHDFDIDHPGKDSYELRKAGAEQMLVASDKRWALVIETPDQDEVLLEELLAKIDAESCDLVLVEGFRHLSFPKIELHRPSLGKDLIHIDDESVIAVASDEYIDCGDLPLLNLNDVGEIAGFICRWLRGS